MPSVVHREVFVRRQFPPSRRLRRAIDMCCDKFVTIHSVSLLVLAASLTACHHQAPVVRPSLTPAAAALAPARVVPAATRVPSATATRALTEDEIFARESLGRLNAARPLGDAFFDYDSATIGADAQASLAKDAEWLRRWGTTRVTVSGHCDERGTPEYNLALGEERAAAVRSYLESLGVAADRITTISYGKERPFCTAGEDDSCLSQNRRGHFLETAK
jgi:peptidoglycan-associated lipoprotein